MDEAEFNRLAQQGYNRIPLVVETLADLDTPLSIYLKLANQPYSYLLESVQGGDRFCRYSYIGLAATTRIEVRERAISVITKQQTETFISDDPLDFIAAYQAKLKAAPALQKYRVSQAAWPVIFPMTRFDISNANWKNRRHQTI